MFRALRGRRTSIPGPDGRTSLSPPSRLLLSAVLPGDFGAVACVPRRRMKISMSRPRSASTARTALSASSAALEAHSNDPAPMPRYPASAHAGARPVASARPGSGRSRFAGHQRRIRLEARAHPWAAIPPHDSVQDPSPTRLWKLWKNSGCGTADTRWAFERAVRRLYDSSPGLRSPERGRRGRNLGKSANFPALCIDGLRRSAATA